MIFSAPPLHSVGFYAIMAIKAEEELFLSQTGKTSFHEPQKICNA